jgi:hypothetical protein
MPPLLMMNDAWNNRSAMGATASPAQRVEKVLNVTRAHWHVLTNAVRRGRRSRSSASAAGGSALTGH